MEKQAGKFIEYIIETLKSTEQFVVEQAPLFVQEYLSYWFFTHLLIAFSFFTLLTVLYFIIRLYAKKSNGWEGEAKPIITFIYILLQTAIVVPQIWQAIKIQVAPKVYLFDSFSHFLQ